MEKKAPSFTELASENRKIGVKVSTYRAKDSSGNSKVLHILRNDTTGVVALVAGQRSRRGPTTIKCGGVGDERKYRSQAFFSMSNSGFARENIEVINCEVKRSDELWEKYFSKCHDTPLGRNVFMNILGGDKDTPFEDIMIKAAQIEENFDPSVKEKTKSVRRDPVKKPVGPYDGSAIYGMF